MALRTRNSEPAFGTGARNVVLTGGYGELIIQYGASLANSIPVEINLRKSSFPIYFDGQSDTSIQGVELLGGSYVIDRDKLGTEPTGVKFFTAGEEIRETATFQILSGGGKVILHPTAGSPYEDNVLTEGKVIGLDELTFPINFPGNYSITVLPGAWVNTGAGVGGAWTLHTDGATISGTTVRDGQGAARFTNAAGESRTIRLNEVTDTFGVGATESLVLLGNSIAFTS